MGSLQTGIDTIKSKFHSVMDMIVDAYKYPSGTLRENEAKAGLFLHLRGNSMLMDGDDTGKNEARIAFLRNANIFDGMGIDDLFGVIENLERTMQAQFPELRDEKLSVSDIAFNKTSHIVKEINNLDPDKIKSYARKYDYTMGNLPIVVVDNQHNSLG